MPASLIESGAVFSDRGCNVLLGNALSTIKFSVAFLIIALVFDMGIKYRVQLMWSATHPSTTRPATFRIHLAARHVCLAVLVCWGAYLYQLRPITEITTGLVLFVVVVAIYGALVIRDAIREMRSSPIG